MQRCGLEKKINERHVLLSMTAKDVNKTRKKMYKQKHRTKNQSRCVYLPGDCPLEVGRKSVKEKHGKKVAKRVL